MAYEVPVPQPQDPLPPNPSSWQSIEPKFQTMTKAPYYKITLKKPPGVRKSQCPHRRQPFVLIGPGIGRAETLAPLPRTSD